MKRLILWTIALALSLPACFGSVKNRGKVVSYEPGRVKTRSGHYEVGPLPARWQPTRLDKAIIAFQEPVSGSTLSTNSFCDRTYNDAPLKSLTQHLFTGLGELKVISEQKLELDGREALYTRLSAKLDGIPVQVGLVVVKKDWCLFDFFLVTPESHYQELSSDFRDFYSGFRFSGAWIEKKSK